LHKFNSYSALFLVCQAFSIFIVLCSRVILAFDLNTYIPLSKVDENMDLAHRRNAVRNERFWFRRHLVVPEGGVPEYEDVAEQMSVQQILMGKGTYFPGLIPMIFAYLDATGNLQPPPPTLPPPPICIGNEITPWSSFT
jgi:hypothetical protein